MEQLQSVDQFNELRKSGHVIFVFSASWCPDCRVIEPILPEIEAENQAFTFIEVDRDDFIDIGQDYDIFGIPSFLAFKDGIEIGRFVSKDRKSKEEITDFIKGLE